MRTVLDEEIEPDDHMQPETVALYGEITVGSRTRPSVASRRE
jgi:hypothetical protein